MNASLIRSRVWKARDPPSPSKDEADATQSAPGIFALTTTSSKLFPLLHLPSVTRGAYPGLELELRNPRAQ